MKAKYESKIFYPNGKVKVHQEKFGTSSRFWDKQVKLSAKDKIKVNYTTKSIKGKPVVTSVRSDFRDGTYMTTSLLDTKQLNKSVRHGNASMRAKNSLSSFKKKI